MDELRIKYRPKRFSDIVGLGPEFESVLQRLAKNNPHAGFEYEAHFGGGKTSVAIVTAQSILCTGRKEGSAEPCLECPACKNFEADPFRSFGFYQYVYVDCTRLEKIKLKKYLYDINNYRFMNSGSKRLVFLFDEFHRTPEPVQELFLNPLETKSNAVFIFCIATEHKNFMEPALSQRLLKIEINTPRIEEIVQLMTKVCDEEAARVEDSRLLEDIGEFAGKNPRLCLNILGECLILAADNGRIINERIVDTILKRNQKLPPPTYRR